MSSSVVQKVIFPLAIVYLILTAVFVIQGWSVEMWGDVSVVHPAVDVTYWIWLIVGLVLAAVSASTAVTLLYKRFLKPLLCGLPGLRCKQVTAD